MSFSASPLAAWFSFIIVIWLMLSASNKPMKKKAVEVRGYRVSLHTVCIKRLAKKTSII